MVLVIDPRTGLAGDMFIGALIDLGVDVFSIIDTFSEIAEININRETEGVQVKVIPKFDELSFNEALDLLKRICDLLSMNEKFKQLAIRIVKILFEAEEWAHKEYKIGHPGALHEASDIIVDASLSAYALQQLRASEIYCLYPVYYGGGVVHFSHGVFEVPAPATRYIISKYNIPAEKGPVDTELLTPTGAAILAALQPLYLHRLDLRKNFEIISSGKGRGAKKLPIPNVLRVYLAKKRGEVFLEKVIELETNLDDVSPEVIGDLFSSIPEALDIQVIPVIGKKNRPAYLLRIWCYEEDEKEVVNEIFRLTGTLGIRRYVIERYVRPRWVKVKKIRVRGKEFIIRFKDSKPEHEDLLRISREIGLSVVELERMILSGDIEVVNE